VRLTAEDPKGTLPVAVVQHNSRRCGGNIVPRAQWPPYDCLCADGREVITRDIFAPRDIRGPVAAETHFERPANAATPENMAVWLRSAP